MTDELTADSLRLGSRVGPWRVEGYAGHGSYGAVYRARHTGYPGSAPVALKLALFPYEPRFMREAEPLSRFRHPSIPQLLDWGWWQAAGGARHPYLVAEWVRGLPLYDWARVHRHGSLQVLRVVAQLAALIERMLARAPRPEGRRASWPRRWKRRRSTWGPRQGCRCWARSVPRSRGGSCQSRALPRLARSGRWTRPWPSRSLRAPSPRNHPGGCCPDVEPPPGSCCWRCRISRCLSSGVLPADVAGRSRSTEGCWGPAKAEPPWGEVAYEWQGACYHPMLAQARVPTTKKPW